MSTSIEEILGNAAEQEKEYEWLQASGFYEQALDIVDEGDFFRRGEIQEKNGHSLHRAAFQAENREEFLERLSKAVEAYNTARGFYENVADEKGDGWTLRSEALVRYLEHWITTDPSEKRRLLAVCLELEGNALESFWVQGEKLEYCRTYNVLTWAPYFKAFREWDRKSQMNAFNKGTSWGEKAVEALSEKDNPRELARAHFADGLNLKFYIVYFESDPEKRQRNVIERHEQHDKVVELSEGVGDAYTAGLSHNYLAREYNFDKAIEHGEKTKDIFLKSSTLGRLAWDTYYKAHATEDPDHRLRLAEEAMGYYDEDQQYSSIMSYQVFQRGKLGAPAPGGYAEYYWDRARWEVTLEKKLELLEKSVDAGLKALKVTEVLDIPHLISRMHHILSGALTSRASLEQDVTIKSGLLEKAMEHREKSIEILEGVQPTYFWNLGYFHILLGKIKVEQALLQQDLDSKRMFLEDAVSTLETGLENMMKQTYPWDTHSREAATLSRCREEYGAILTRLHELTKDPEHMRKAIETWGKAIEFARGIDMTARIAELYWKIAKSQDVIGERSDAAESFENASGSYVKTAEKIPQLKDFYKEYASYMRAWAEFERAQQSHTEKDYLQAKEHYEKAANLHKSTERWGYMAPNYLAWARLEEAEDLSRREEAEEARDLFHEAVMLFSETRDSIKSKLNTIEVGEEKQIAEELIKASANRREYCLGRVALEEARILDRQGDHLSSARKYSQATEMFQKGIDAMELESDRKELRPLVYLCQAWEKTMLAEARTSPEFYNEAAELFEQARKHALDQSTSLLAQAHSSFCKALEASTRFELTRMAESFSEAKRHIEAAMSQYLRAGYRTMSDYAGATSRLLDAYQYSYNAQLESDTKKKAQFYQVAERLLQSSAGAYLKAKHPEKSDEVRRILERVKEEREIAVSLSEVLHAPTIVSTTTSFSTPTPTHEQAVGLERFDSADIQANLITRRREVGVGEDLDLEIEMVNAGKSPAQLVKVEDIVIPGFELKSYPEICRVEDSYLDMKGRTLSPLKTQELKLVLKPLTKGAFELKPRILYLDEAGNYKSHEPEPVLITVQELGIKGWLRGPTR